MLISSAMIVIADDKLIGLWLVGADSCFVCDIFISTLVIVISSDTFLMETTNQVIPCRRDESSWFQAPVRLKSSTPSSGNCSCKRRRLQATTRSDGGIHHKEPCWQIGGTPSHHPFLDGIFHEKNQMDDDLGSSNCSQTWLIYRWENSVGTRWIGEGNLSGICTCCCS